MATPEDRRAEFDLADQLIAGASKEPRRTFISLLALLLVLGLAACVLDRQVKNTEPASDGPTVYGRIHVSVDHVSTR